MSAVLLIDITAFESDKLIPATTDPAKVDAAIQKAQELDLCPLLGDAFYSELVMNFDPDNSGGPDAQYQKLMDGEQYVNSIGETIIFSGLRMALKIWAYARFIGTHQRIVTTHSIVNKTNPWSEPVDPKAIAMDIANCRSEALAYWYKTKKYLDSKKDDFPLWKCEKSKPRPGIRITAVGGNN